MMEWLHRQTMEPFQMQILPFLPFNCQPFNCQARFRRSNREKRGMSGRGIFDIACELAGLTGLLGWLAALFYLTGVAWTLPGALVTYWF